MGARSATKATDAINAIKSDVQSSIDIEHLPLDLTSLPSVKQAANKIASEADRLDLLVLNAGIMAVPPSQTEAGFEIQIGTNHVGHFLLTKLLLPLLQKTADKGEDVRVISLASEAWNLGPNLATMTSTEKLLKQSDWSRYGASKAANITFAAELARRHPELTSVSLHPGIIMTELHTASQQKFSLVGFAMKWMAPFIARDIPGGALNTLWLAAGAKKDQLQNGAYYTPVGNLKGSNKWSTDANAGKTLWNWTETELANVGY